jgi:chitinase
MVFVRISPSGREKTAGWHNHRRQEVHLKQSSFMQRTFVPLGNLFCPGRWHDVTLLRTFMNTSRVPYRRSLPARAVTTAIIFLLGWSQGTGQQQIVLGYYPMWAKAALPAQDVMFSSITHVNHAFAWPNPDGSLAYDDQTVDTAIINATHRAGRKILLSLGGAGEVQTQNFSTVCADSNLRHAFIGALVSHLVASGYDGADLDWEGPASVPDRVNEVILVRELRSALSAADSSLLLTMAVGVSNWSQQWRDFNALMPYINWFAAMTYDFYGSWSSTTGHNAPLYAPANSDGCISDGLAYLRSTRNIPAEKLLLGLPFYGKLFNGTATLYSPYTPNQVSYLGYTDIVSLQKNQPGWIYTWDAVSHVPYLSNTSLPGIITFDDSASLAGKCSYALQNKLAGVMIWEITQDVSGSAQPLMRAVADAMSSPASGIARDHPPVVASRLLLDNYPNPFNPQTTIDYAVPESGHVRLSVFDLLGREVSILVNEFRPSGSYSIRFDGRNQASGVYFTVLSLDHQRVAHAIVLMR